MLAQRHLENRRQLASNRAQRAFSSSSSSLPSFLAEIRSSSSSTEQQNQKQGPVVDDWCDSQQAVNHAVSRIRRNDNDEQEEQQQQHSIKVIQTFRNPLSLSSLWSSLVACQNVASLSLVGVQLDAGESLKLGLALSDVGTCISQLQVCRLLPTGIDAFCESFVHNKHVKELRLTFNHDVSPNLATKLLRAIAEQGVLTSLKLYGIDLSTIVDDIAMMVRACCGQLRELRLTRCHLTHNIYSLTRAIKDTNCLEIVDLSMNEISLGDNDNDDKLSSAVTLLLETPSIKELILSQNELGGKTTTATRENHNAARPRDFCHTLARNTTLTSLSLDMNPLSVAFATDLERISLARNTTLTRLGILTSSLHTSNNNNNNKHEEDSGRPPALKQRLRHLVLLNQAGRGWIRNTTTTTASDEVTSNDATTTAAAAPCSPTKLFSRVLARYSEQPQVLYSFLQERPDLWM